MTMPPPGPLRDAYIAGATAEANHREAPRKAAPRHVRELLDYADALVEHSPERASTPGRLLASAAYVFSSTLTRPERRAIRRALRGKLT